MLRGREAGGMIFDAVVWGHDVGRVCPELMLHHIWRGKAKYVYVIFFLGSYCLTSLLGFKSETGWWSPFNG